MRAHLGSEISAIFVLPVQLIRIKYKMQGKYFLLVLIISYSQNIASSHILTSAYVDMSLPACARLLAYAVINDLCPTYGDYSSEYTSPIEQQLSLIQQEHKDSIVKKCCSQPCTLNELIAMC